VSDQLKALLFDLDGTLTDTGEQHFLATMTALKDFGKSIDRETYDHHIHGNSNDNIAEYFFPNGDKTLQKQYVDHKELTFRNMLSDVDPVAGLVELMAWAKQHSLLLALVTAAPVENKDATLRALGMETHFDTVVLGDDLARSKPDPLPYQTALERLGVLAGEAIGFEDSLHGIQSVTGAGVFTVGITTGLPASRLIAKGANLAVPDYQDKALWQELDIRQTSVIS